MKTFSVIIVVVTFIIPFVFSSCSDDEPCVDPDIEGDSQVWHSATLYFDPILSNQSSRALSEAQSYKPSDNDLLAITFTKSGEQSVKGYAIYNGSEHRWDLTYLGNLTSCTNEKCEIIYIGNNPHLDNEQMTVSFSAQSPIFDCKSGIYAFNGDNAFYLYATLSPITSRVRFKGANETAIEMRGFGTYNKFTFSDWQLGQVDCLDAISCNVLNTLLWGCITPYYYIYSQKSGDYGFTKCNNLWIKEGDVVYLWKKKTSEILTEGASGLINLPSIDANGWLSDTYRTKTISDITISTNGVWTQTQSLTKFYSKVGIQVNLTYTITSQSSQTVASYPFVIGYWAYDENGDYLGSWDNGVHKDDIKLNKAVDYHEEYYVEGASYYQIQFYGLNVSAKITNFKISTF